MKTLLFCFLLPCIASAEWVADLPPSPRLFGKGVGEAVLLPPPDLAGGGELTLALRTVDVFGNVSAPSESVTLTLPASLPPADAPPLPELTEPPRPVTNTLEPVLPRPTDFRVRLDARSGRLHLSWTPVVDPEAVGYQLLRAANPPAADLSDSRKLALWLFPKLGEGEDRIPDEAWLAAEHDPALERPRLVLGPDYSPFGSSHQNNRAIPLSSGSPSADPEMRPGGYIEWTLSPAPGQALRLDTLMVGLWQQRRGETLHHRLAYSLDGFATRREIPLRLQGEQDGTNLNAHIGVPALADLRAEPALRRVDRPVTFRLHLWGGVMRGIGKLGQRDPDTRKPVELPDLWVEGTALPR